MNYLKLSLLSMALASTSAPPVYAKSKNDIQMAAYAEKANVQFLTGSCEQTLKGVTGPTDQAGVIIGALATVVAKSLTEYVGALLKAKRDEKTGAFSAQGFATEGKNYKCMAVIRGKFGPSNATKNSGKITPTGLKLLDLAQSPDFLSLLDMETVGQNLQLKTHYLHYGATSAKSKGSGVKDITMSINLSTPKPKATQSTSQAKGDQKKEAAPAPKPAAIQYGKREIGFAYDGSTLAGDMTIIPMSKTLKGFSAIVTVTETENPNLALKIFVDNYEKKSDDLSTAIEGIIKKAAGVKEEKK